MSPHTRLIAVKIVLGSLFLLVMGVSIPVHADAPVYQSNVSPKIFVPSLWCGATFGAQLIGGTYFGVAGYSSLLKDPIVPALGTSVCGSPTTDMDWISNSTTSITLSSGNHNWVNIAQTYGDGNYFYSDNAGQPSGQWGFVKAYASSSPLFFNTYEELIYSNPTATSTIATTYQTRFTNGTMTGTSTAVSSDIEYYLNTDEYTVKNRPDFIQSNILKRGFFSDDQVATSRKLITPLSTGLASTTINYDYTFSEGSYVAYFMFWNIDTNFLTFGKSTMTLSFDIDGSGNVANMVISEITNGQVADSGYAYEECGITNIMGCIKNALVWLFYPTSTILDNFSTLWQNIADKKPFGYVTVTITQLIELNTSGTTAFDLGVVPFMGSIFTPLRTLVASILWGLFAIYFYKNRLIHLDI